MPRSEIELDSVDFVTVGTVGPKGKRLFHLQAGRGKELVTLIIEKEQARALGEAIGELLSELEKRYPDLAPEVVRSSQIDMSLRDPIEPLFRVAQMGLGYEEERSMIVLVAEELVATDQDELAGQPDTQVVRIWGTPEQMRALSEHAGKIVGEGRADPKSNGHLTYYWV